MFKSNKHSKKPPGALKHTHIPNTMADIILPNSFSPQGYGHWATTGTWNDETNERTMESEGERKMFESLSLSEHLCVAKE